MRNKSKSFWHGKSVLVTGASSGLGSAIVEALAPYQINFCLLSRREKELQELAARQKNSGSNFWIRACDVQRRETVYSAINDFFHETGRLDVAWVNSGIGTNSSFQKWNWEKVESVIDTNLKGAIYTIRACLEIMVPQNSGTIIGIGSAVALRGVPTRGIYGLTKIGLEYFIESLAAELPQIQFTLIHPGFVDTPINQGSSHHRIWLMTPEKAAQLMIKAVGQRKKVYIYPVRMKLLFHFMRMLPLPIYLWLARKIIKEHYREKSSAQD
ncbi:MAG: SDR family NAD(P)-dependent oxidoreductase [bacterium]|nr:SDR family NAD(P)-dependent oxidoreductase [bacterium]